jgi:hypothetical protein
MSDATNDDPRQLTARPAADAGTPVEGTAWGVPASQEEVIAAALAAVLGQVRTGLDAVQRVADQHPEVREALRGLRESASRLGREPGDAADGR